MKLNGASHLLLCAAFALLAAAGCSKNPQRSKMKYFEDGQQYLDQKRYGDAAIEFRKALQIDPRFAEAYGQLAAAAMGQHDWTAAYAAFDRIVDLDPKRLDARLNRGRILYAGRKYDLAKADAEFIISLDSKNDGAYQLLGSALVGMGQYDQALVAFQKASSLFPSNSSIYHDMALIEAGTGRNQKAEADLQKEMETDSTSSRPYVDLFRLYRQENRPEDAQKMLQLGLQRNPDAVPLYIEFASALTSAGNSDGSEAYIDNLRRRLPESPDAVLAITDFYLQHKQPEKAVLEGKRGLAVLPNNIELKKQIQNANLQLNRIGEATDMDRDLMKSAPRDLIVRTEHGRLLLAQGKLDEATLYLQKITADAPDFAEAKYVMALAYLKKNELAQAKSSAQDALKLSPGVPLVLEMLATINLAQNNPDTAQYYAQQIVTVDPNDASGHALLAKALARQGHWKQAETEYSTAKRLAPDDAGIRLSLAQVLSAERKTPDSEKEFEDAAKANPHNTTLLARWAEFLIANGRQAEAIAHVADFVRTNPRDTYGYGLQGWILSEVKDYDHAVAALQRAIELDSTNLEAYMQLGAVYRSQGKVDLAISTYQTVAKSRPQASVSAMIGNLYLEKGQLDSAAQYYNQALRSDPNLPIANANLAWVDAEEGKDLDIALGMAQKAKSLLPDHPAISDTLAWIMYKKHNYSGAIPLFNECLKVFPQSANCHYHLGLTFLAAGQKTQARDQLQWALKLDLSQTEVNQAHQILAQLN